MDEIILSKEYAMALGTNYKRNATAFEDYQLLYKMDYVGNANEKAHAETYIEKIKNSGYSETYIVKTLKRLEVWKNYYDETGKI